MSRNPRYDAPPPPSPWPEGTRVLLLPWGVVAPLEARSAHDPDLRVWFPLENDGLIRCVRVLPAGIVRLTVATDYREDMERSLAVLRIETARAILTRKWSPNGLPAKLLDEPVRPPSPPSTPTR